MPKKLDDGMQFVDLGVILRTKLEEASKLIMEHVKKIKPAIVVIDSFKVFVSTSRSRSARKMTDVCSNAARLR